MQAYLGLSFKEKVIFLASHEELESSRLREVVTTYLINFQVSGEPQVKNSLTKSK